MSKEIQLTEGNLVLDDARIAIVCSRFNHFIVDQLEKGAVDILQRHGVVADNIEIFKVPGAFELPLITKKVAETKNFEAIIVLGAIIRGSTTHFEYISSSCASSLSKVAMQTSIPVVFGVLTTDTIEQAIERAGTKAGNKGGESALSAIEMVSLLRKINQSNNK